MTSGSGPSNPPDGFEKRIFINCPFDGEFIELLRPMVFTVVFAGYEPALSSQRSDSGESRLEKICGFIYSSQYGIHDISRMKATHKNQPFRLNMPFELGIDYGTRKHGPGYMSQKVFLVLETDQHEYHKAISDLSGMDIKKHEDDPFKIVRCVRHWMYESLNERDIERERIIFYEFNDFMTSLHDDFSAAGVKDRDVKDEISKMPIQEYIDKCEDWTAQNQ